ncbi:MAG: tRNA (adenosine(37)-N6)-dimethylallyltransferase MiaA [Verrucomicrobia bacterium]|jgi:tRNA dimethylallyltransferase|nr:tRNA (adenosine(37)-N6)-dimethylallyltransferase MiaA [Verrucomicrobiota bacterium]
MATPDANHPPSSIPHPRPIFLAGPTAAGKSEIALCLAEKLGGEIISVDSMQVYRGLDIGTAKSTPAERARVPHHLVDVVDLTAPFDAAKFVALANQAVAEIQSRGRVPIFCGGTGLYFKAHLEGLGEAPVGDPKLRAELEAAPLADLLRELEQRDPVTFSKIDRKNPRRVIRAVEVIRLTGKPFSAQRARWGEAADEPQPAMPGSRGRAPHQALFGFSRTSDDLRSRINARVDKMFAAGLVEETRRLLAQGLVENKTAMQAIGYRQVVEHLRGERSLPETIELVKSKTRQFAKRQMTWFRLQLKLEWIELTPMEALDEVAQRILNHR